VSLSLTIKESMITYNLGVAIEIGLMY